MVCKKIGIDFHGVVNTNPVFFRELIDLVQKQGIEVHIISGGPRETISRYLEEHHIDCSCLWCIYDHYEKSNKVKFFADGSFHIEDELWNKAKAQYCLQEGIGLHIDDSTIYGRCFETPYCLYDEKHQTCIINGKTIDFSSPQKALAGIMDICD